MKSSAIWRWVQTAAPFMITKEDTHMQTDLIVDTKGMACPMPIVKAKRALDSLQPGQIMEVLSTDKGSVNDFQAWVKQTKHELVKHEENNGNYTFFVRKI
jgi:tRNA 2-thiouridine synthesizing protein A